MPFLKPDGASEGDNAIEFLKGDHKEVDELFTDYEDAKDNHASLIDKVRIAARVCDALKIHAMIEEEIFYPAVAAGVEGAADLLAEARVEHNSLRRLISDIEESDPAVAEYDADVKVLSEYVKHHVHEEEHQLFPKVKKSELDLVALGLELALRKQQLAASTMFKAVNVKTRTRARGPVIDIGAPGVNG